jgi:hypothetical protein
VDCLDAASRWLKLEKIGHLVGGHFQTAAALESQQIAIEAG